MQLVSEVTKIEKANKSVIDSLVKEKEKLSVRPLKEKCVICLEFLDKFITFPVCDHKFHKDCLLKHLQTSCKCPLCRVEVADCDKDTIDPEVEIDLGESTSPSPPPAPRSRRRPPLSGSKRKSKRRRTKRKKMKRKKMKRKKTKRK